MKEIVKKTYSELFDKVVSGEKTFDVRLDDFEANVGDILVLKEIDENRNCTGRELRKKIIFVSRTKNFEKKGWFSKEDIDKHGFAIMGLK